MRLYESCVRLAYRLANAFHARHPGYDRDDLGQEALLAVWRAAGRYDPRRGCRFNTVAWRYVSTALANFARNRATRLQLTVQHHFGRYLVEELIPAPEPPRPHYALDGLPSALDTLERQEQRVVELRSEGLTLHAIGRLIGRSRERVRQIEQLALDKLRERLAAA